MHRCEEGRSVVQSKVAIACLGQRTGMPDESPQSGRPSATTSPGRMNRSSRSSQNRQALISPAFGFSWMRRLPRRLNLKCFTALVT